jgi:hypothetical protein
VALLAWLGLLTLWVLAAGAASAQTRDPAAGEALFQEGRRLMKAGDFAGACPKLEESLRLDPALGTLVNLAACEEERGRTATAWEHWRAAADQLPSGDKRRATALARATALERVLPHLTITLAAEVSSEAEVKRDGVRLGRASLGLPLPVDPGSHVVTLVAPGREPRELETTLRAKENQTLTLEPGPEVKVAKAQAPPVRWEDERAPVHLVQSVMAPPVRGRSSTAVAGWLVTGVGVAALAGAGYFGLQALSARKDAKKACSDAAPSFCWKDARDPLDRDRRDSLIADVLGGAGLVVTGVGLYLVLRGPGESTTTAQVTPLPGGGLVDLSGRF